MCAVAAPLLEGVVTDAALLEAVAGIPTFAPRLRLLVAGAGIGAADRAWGEEGVEWEPDVLPPPRVEAAVRDERRGAVLLALWGCAAALIERPGALPLALRVDP